MREAGVSVTGDTNDYKADIIMTDLKGLSNLIPSLSSGQVEIWAGPVPNPQNAEAQGIGKIIATLDELPGGKWIDFPCCTMNIRNEIKEKYPEVIDALVQVTVGILDFAENNNEETAKLMVDYIGLNEEILLKNDTTYGTETTDNFINGMHIYYEVMESLFDFRYIKDK